MKYSDEYLASHLSPVPAGYWLDTWENLYERLDSDTGSGIVSAWVMAHPNTVHLVARRPRVWHGVTRAVVKRYPRQS